MAPWWWNTDHSVRALGNDLGSIRQGQLRFGDCSEPGTWPDHRDQPIWALDSWGPQLTQPNWLTVAQLRGLTGPTEAV